METISLPLDEVVALEDFSGVIPLFPLSTVVFFPHTLLPLHIFEPRYREMVNDVIDNEKIIGMVLLKPGWEKDYAGNPEIFDVAGMGRIINVEPAKDGRMNIVLYGLKRVRIVDIVKEHPYRSAKVEIMDNEHTRNDKQYSKRLDELVASWNKLLGKEYESKRIRLQRDFGLEQAVDFIASSEISNVFEKQDILEEKSLHKRAEKVISYLETRYEIVSIMEGKRPDQILEKRNLN
ncbi:MAG: LON peptidase substrate-binding domain-containing protein [Candidatus Dadabacteria bacterium]|nr:LON peptidase substrate-binding domain-containing protein [Candidatus Dadabacteria bacterium]